MDEQSTSSQTPVKGTAPKNTNRWDTRQLVTMAVLVAIGFLISFIEIPFPAAPFLKYDPSSVAMLVGGFTFGPLVGAVVGILIAVLHYSTDGPVGVVMNIIAMLAMGVPAALIYKRTKTRTGAAIGLAVGTVSLVVFMILANLVIDPIFYGMPAPVVVAGIVPFFLPFNLIKGLLNGVITFLVYKSISNVVKPSK